MKESLSIGQARRVVLAAQGFTWPERSGAVNWGRMAPMIRRLNLLQIDSVNVLVRSHYLPLFSRLGSYPHATLDERSFGSRKRALFECWAHEASLLPLELHPLVRWRMARARAGNGTYGQMDRFGREEQRYLKEVLAFVAANGPTAASEVPGGGKSDGGWWGWSRGKLALETLFDQGLLTTATRAAFERFYDIPERVIPAETLALPTPREADAIRQLLDLSGLALGVATEADLRDYFRLPVAETKAAVMELVEEGALVPATVEGWKQRAYLHRDAKLPRKAGGTALLSPFDPLVWERSRAERLFGFHYRIEIYTPAPKRKFGYYVLPFLNGDRIAGRVCLKADRQAGVLRANAIHHEPHADAQETATALAEELRRMAAWLGLPAVEAGDKGNLSAALRSAL
ncbi:winged helix-turn-helix domain-containing protein [Aestuariivirga sp.]|uniref:winged helix-turn-helix domain-containing protein n=1 Tax=Aestuariivirga sp. TaxID=2650926 RepID=UPI00391970E7